MNNMEDQPPILVPYIFVSHSGMDNDFGTKLVQDLRNAFHNEDAVWYDRLGGLRAGVTWWEEIQQQILARYFFLLIMSPDAFASQWVNDEINIAWRERNKKRKYIIPVYYRDCNNVRPDIALIERIDFRDCDTNASIYLQALDRLLADIGTTGMELISRQTFNQQLVKRRVLTNRNAQPEPEAIIEELLPNIKEAFRRKNWAEVIRDAQVLIKRVPGAIPSELYKMQGLAALHLGNWSLAENAQETFFAQVGNIGQRLSLLLNYIELLSKRNQSDRVRNYTHSVMDIAQDDPYWFSRVLQQLSLLVTSDTENTFEQPGFAPLPSYLSHAYTYTHHTKEVYGVAWSPDDKYIASVSEDHTLRVWNPTNGRDALDCPHPQVVRSVAWSPELASNDFWHLATACDDGKVYLWEVAPDKGQRNLIAEFKKGHHDRVRSVAWSPDGRYLASAGDDGKVCIWEMHQKTLARHFQHDGWVNAVAWSPASENGVYRYVASASHDNTVKVWNRENGRCRYTYTGHQKAVYDLVWSPNGTTIASTSADKTIQVWEYNTGNHGTIYKEHKDTVVSLARSPYGRRIVSSSKNDFHLWYAATGDRILNNTPDVGWIRKVAWSHNGLFIALAAGNDNTVQIWRVGGNI
jgi:WD40 repeat protein